MKKIGTISVLLLLYLFIVNPLLAQQKAYLRTPSKVAKIDKMEDQFQQIYHMLIGSFVAEQKTETANKVITTEMMMVAIPMAYKKGESWVYVEYFAKAIPSQPISQFFWKIKQETDHITVQSSYLKDPKKFVNEWEKGQPFENKTPEKLINKDKQHTCLMEFQLDKQHPEHFQSTPHDTENLCNSHLGYGDIQFVGYAYDVYNDKLDIQANFYDSEKTEISKIKTTYFRMDKKSIKSFDHSLTVRNK